ncbi:unnamed protein product [Jaminaea pallidilutea]
MMAIVDTKAPSDVYTGDIARDARPGCSGGASIESYIRDYIFTKSPTFGRNYNHWVQLGCPEIDVTHWPKSPSSALPTTFLDLLDSYKRITDGHVDRARLYWRRDSLPEHTLHDIGPPILLEIVSSTDLVVWKKASKHPAMSEQELLWEWNRHFNARLKAVGFYIEQTRNTCPGAHTESHTCILSVCFGTIYDKRLFSEAVFCDFVRGLQPRSPVFGRRCSEAAHAESPFQWVVPSTPNPSHFERSTEIDTAASAIAAQYAQVGFTDEQREKVASGLPTIDISWCLRRADLFKMLSPSNSGMTPASSTSSAPPSSHDLSCAVTRPTSAGSLDEKHEAFNASSRCLCTSTADEDAFATAKLQPFEEPQIVTLPSEMKPCYAARTSPAESFSKTCTDSTLPKARDQQTREKMKRYAARVKRQRQTLALLAKDLYDTLSAQPAGQPAATHLLSRPCWASVDSAAARKAQCATAMPSFASSTEKLNWQKRASKARKRTNEGHHLDAIALCCSRVLMEADQNTSATSSLSVAPAQPRRTSSVVQDLEQVLVAHQASWEDLRDAEKRLRAASWVPTRASLVSPAPKHRTMDGDDTVRDGLDAIELPVCTLLQALMVAEPA